MNEKEFWFARLFMLALGVLIYSMPSQYRTEAIEEQRQLEEELRGFTIK